MATLALLNAWTYVDGHDFTGDTNQVNLNMEAVALNKTTFRNNGWTSLQGGLKSATFEQAGFWSAGDGEVDPDLFTNLAVRNRVHTFGPAEEEGGTAYLWKAGQYTYSLLGSLGEMAPFQVQAQGSDSVGVVRGQLAKKMGAAASAGPLGSPVNLGAGGPGQFLYATLHVFAAGTTLSVKVESDSAQAFTTPSDVAGATIGPVTTVGGTWMAQIDASAITDTWFRLNVTAVTGSFTVAAALAIQ
ncbi:hypothetical protein [Amycolatopsis suaedae]|uniref:Uncharacterized protein n=1 Tax=Amycolatopsis suaedae TaxID=2510978 RepID=A0A4Q7J0E2_9PSEU|nr:hypothetical protein [Amycolatopsis suaedae]RZQ59836.1 hypothetical protein EWH70_32500 [Amycolatopsis suaedae]